MMSCDYYAGPYLRVDSTDSAAPENNRVLTLEDLEAFDSRWAGQFMEQGAGQNRLWLSTSPAYHRIILPTEGLKWPESHELVFDDFLAAYNPLIRRVQEGLGVCLLVGFGMLPVSTVPVEIASN